MTAAEWNRTYPVGQEVHWRFLIGDPPRPGRTASAARALEDGTSVIAVSDGTGVRAVALDCVAAVMVAGQEIPLQRVPDDGGGGYPPGQSRRRRALGEAEFCRGLAAIMARPCSRCGGDQMALNDARDLSCACGVLVPRELIDDLGAALGDQ